MMQNLILMLLFLYKLLAYAGDENAINLNNQAMELQMLGKLDSALIIYDKAISIDPHFILAYVNKSGALMHLNRNKQALETLQIATQFEHAYAELFVGEGIAFERCDDFQKAKESYKKAINLFNKREITTDNYQSIVEIAILLTFTHSKEFASMRISNIINKYNPKGYDLENILMFKNEIDCYKGGGYLEIFSDEKIDFCLTTDQNIDEVKLQFLKMGVNIKSSSSHEGSNNYRLGVKEKFAAKALSLGLKKCKNNN